MIPYLILLLFVSFWIFIEEKSLNRKAVFVPFLSLAFFCSLRSHLVGTDTGAYTSDYRNGLSSEYYVFRTDIEYGFQLLNYFTLKFTHNYFWLFFISSIIILFSYLFVFKKRSDNYLLSVFIFITFGFYTFYFNGLRQGLAMAIAALSVPYLIEKNIIKFLFLTIIAYFFHKSALIMLLFYILINWGIKLEYKIILIFMTSLLFSGMGIQYLASVNDKYSGYSEVSDHAGGYLTIFLYFIIGIFIYCYMRLYRNYNENFFKLFQLYFLGVVFLIPVAMLGSDASGPQRLLFYFVWPLTLLIPKVLKDFNNILLYILFVVFSFFYFCMVILSYSNLVPYHINDFFRIF